MDLFTLAAKLTLDYSGFERGINKAEKQGASLASKLGKGLGKAAKWAAGGMLAGVTATTAAITSLTKSAVQQYANYEQLVGGVETLFGTGGRSLAEFQKAAGITAKSTQQQIDEVSRSYIKHQEAQQIVMENARKAYRTAGVDMNSYMQTATSFSAALVSGLSGDTKKAAQITDMAIVDMADNANKMGTSLESIQNAYQGFAKQNYTMLDNLKLGYGGTKTEMQRLLKDAEKLTGKRYNLKNLSDVYEAIHAIQTEMGITGTTSKEASTTIQGSFGMMKAAWTNLQIAIADPNGDIGGAIQDMVDSAKIAFKNLMPTVKQTIRGIASAVKELAPIVGKELPALIGELAPEVWEIFKGFVSGVWDGLTSFLGEVPWPTWDEVKAAAGSAWETIKSGAKTLAGLVLGTKEDGTVDLPGWDDVSAAAGVAWQSIKDGAAAIADYFGGLVFGRNEDGTVAWPDWSDANIFDAAKAAWEKIQAGALSIADTLGGLVFGRAEDGTVAWPDINQLIEDFGKWWSDTARPAIEKAMVWTLQLSGMSFESAEALASVVGGWWNTVVESAQEVLQWVLNVPNAPPNESGQKLREIITGWWKGIVKSAQDLLQWVLGIPDMEDKNGVAMKQRIKGWWDSFIKPALKGILNFTLGLFGLPSYEEMKQKILEWWKDVMDAVGDLTIYIKTKINPLSMSSGNQAVDEAVNSTNAGQGAQGILNNQNLNRQSMGAIWDAIWHPKAIGSTYIPFDNFPALLHRGEQVITASQARHRNDGVDMSALIPAIVGAVREGMQDVTVRSYLSGRDITDDVSKNTMRAVRARRFAK